MLPECLGGLVVALPVGIHVVEQLGLAGVLDQSGDIFVIARGVAVLLIGAVAFIGPKSYIIIHVDE